MRRPIVVVIVLALLGAVGPAAAQPPTPQNYRAHLAAQEGIETDARGQAVFQLSRDGTEMRFRVNIANLEGATMAHLHHGSASGPIVAWIAGPHDPTDVNGVYAVGALTSDDLEGPLEGQELSDLAAEIEAGEIFLNVHTEEHPPGEIAGQLF
jgi:hypothetical protein